MSFMSSSPGLFLAPFINSTMSRFALLVSFLVVLPGLLIAQKKIDYRYRAPYPTIDTLRVDADFYDESGFHDFEPILMVCGGKAIPAIVDEEWGTTRCYEWMKYYKLDGVEIDPGKLLVMYGIGEDFAAWRKDE